VHDVSGWPKLLSDAGLRIISLPAGALVDAARTASSAVVVVATVGSAVAIRRANPVVQIVLLSDDAECPAADAILPGGSGDAAIAAVVRALARVRNDPARTLADARLAAIVESSDDAIVSKDLGGIIKSWNAGAERIFGYTPEEAVGKSILIIIPDDRREEEIYIVARLKRGERIDHFETVRRTKDGRLIDVSVTVSPLRDQHGTVVGASKVARDITDQKVYRDRLRRSEERLRLALQAGRIGIWEWFIPANKVEWSDRIYEFHGLEADEFDGTVEGFRRLVHEDDLERVSETLARALANQIDYELEFRTRRPDGDVRWLSTRGEVLRDPSGKPIRMVGVTTDITENRRATDQLRHSEAAERARVQEFNALMGSAPAIVLVATDPECRVLLGNQTAYDTLHIESGANLAVVTPAPGRPGTISIFRKGQPLTGKLLPMRRAAAGEIVRDEELEIRFRDGRSIFVYGHTTPVRDEFGQITGAVGVFLDVTELKNTREELSRRIAELGRFNAELQDFAYIASHDLKEPLRGIATCAQFLIEDYGPAMDAEGREKLQTLVRLPKRMYDLLDALLEYARLGRDRLRLDEAELGVLAESAIETVRSAIDAAGAQVIIEHPHARVRVDRVLFAQVLANLIANSVKYNRSRMPRVEVGAAPDGAVFVRDNGIGIAQRHYDAIFRMFRRLHPRESFGGGTGVGLAIVKKIVELHNGRISVESREGHGSTFYLHLPEMPGAGPPPQRAAVVRS
jgi:PAS domain S-box-containing protein